MGKALGTSKAPPDEFAVVKRAPLIMPPEFKLRPPAPGADRPQELDTSELARSALLPAGTSGPENKTAGEVALLRAANAEDVSPGIRITLARESDRRGNAGDDSGGFFSSLMFWQSDDDDENDNKRAKTEETAAAN